jgi:hypothetical protein
MRPTTTSNTPPFPTSTTILAISTIPTISKITITLTIPTI